METLYLYILSEKSIIDIYIYIYIYKISNYIVYIMNEYCKYNIKYSKPIESYVNI